MARSGKKFSLILNTEKVLSTDELLELSEAVEQPSDSQVSPEPLLSTASQDAAAMANPE
jgi:hypothetical protein